MEIPIPEHLKDLWETWDLRVFILLSLFLISFLTIFDPLRKRTANNWLILSLWSAYVLADWAASFAVGTITSSQSEKFGFGNAKTSTNDVAIMAFWAPFLLVHLGGPDTITAFALEDNELWNRVMLGLIFQFLAAVYVFYLSLPKNQLLIPTTLMFVSGLIKSFEKTRTLHLASLDRFRDSLLKAPEPGPNYARLMDEYSLKAQTNRQASMTANTKPSAKIKAVNQVKQGNLTDTECVLYAHRFFQISRGLIVDLTFSFRERSQSRDFFLKRTPKDALKLVEMELNFIHDVLFTKATVVYKKFGHWLRFLSFGLVVASLALFFLEDKNNFKSADIAISYNLLLGGIALDVVAFIKLITSDWLIVNTHKLPDVPMNKTSEQSAHEQNLGEVACPLFGKLVKVLRRRWSGSIPSYNLIYHCLNPSGAKAQKLFSVLNLTGFLGELQYVGHTSPFTEELRDYIFYELQTKSEMADDAVIGTWQEDNVVKFKIAFV